MDAETTRLECLRLATSTHGDLLAHEIVEAASEYSNFVLGVVVTEAAPVEPKAKVANRCCGFCGKSQEEVKQLVVGVHGASICDNCIDLARTVFSV